MSTRATEERSKQAKRGEVQREERDGGEQVSHPGRGRWREGEIYPGTSIALTVAAEPQVCAAG